uniref:Inhibitor of apoptosis-promoting Bax1 family protein n=1 Tax=Strongyloides papillosus TaxID=174720 RepID=A0A0N5BIG6_STREA
MLQGEAHAQWHELPNKKFNSEKFSNADKGKLQVKNSCVPKYESQSTTVGKSRKNEEIRLKTNRQENDKFNEIQNYPVKCTRSLPSILDISSLNENINAKINNDYYFKNNFVRKKFILNVLKVVTSMLIIILTIIALTYIPFIRQWFYNQENRNYISATVCGIFILWAVIYIFTIFLKKPRRQYPCNMILVLLNTLCIGFLSALLTLYFESHLIPLIVLGTMLIVIVIGLLVNCWSIDITRKGVLWNFIILSSLTSILLIILNLLFNGMSWLQNITLFTAILLLSMYLFIELKLILNNVRNEINPDENVFAAIILFTDIIHIFMIIMLFLNRKH